MLRPICYRPKVDDQTKENWVKANCKSTTFDQTGYSGIDADEPTLQSGLLRRLTSNLDKKEGIKDLLFTKAIGPPGNLPFSVSGDSGGPLECLMGNKVENVDQHVLIGVNKGPRIPKGMKREDGYLSATFVPQYWEVICPATNVCPVNDDNL